MRIFRYSLVSTIQLSLRILFVAVCAGSAYFSLGSYRLGLLQGYEALIEVPIATQKDILSIYSQSPFRNIEIEFPPSEISSGFILRVWVPKVIAPIEVETNLNHFLNQFYLTTSNRDYILISALQLELSALKAEEHAKAFEVNYLQKNYPELREQRIEHLNEELDAIEKKVEAKQKAIKSAQNINTVKIGSFKTITSPKISTSLVTQSILIGLFFVLLQLVWVQNKSKTNVTN